jgi:hypothetical protein
VQRRGATFITTSTVAWTLEWVAFLTLKASLSTLFIAALGKFDNRQVGACKSRGRSQSDALRAAKRPTLTLD